MGAAATTIIISPPSEFMPRTNLFGEGYWSPPFHGGYQPIISNMIWPDKDKFLQAVDAVESYRKQRNHYTDYAGFAPSRLIYGENVGTGEYEDKKYGMYWPENYVSYYIDNYHVMPTKRFFNYIVKRVNTLPKKFLCEEGFI